MSFHPWAVFAINFLIMRQIWTEFVWFSVLQANTGSLLDILIGVHCDEKYELERPAFCLKSEIRVPLNKREGMVEIFLLRKLFILELPNIFRSSNFILSLFKGYLCYKSIFCHKLALDV